jgi:hypothetical protein
VRWHCHLTAAHTHQQYLRFLQLNNQPLAATCTPMSESVLLATKQAQARTNDHCMPSITFGARDMWRRARWF